MRPNATRKLESPKFASANKLLQVVELCLARAAKGAQALTNSENVRRDTEKAVKRRVAPTPAWRANPYGLETERGTETQVLGNSRAECRTEPSTSGYGNQFEGEFGSPSATLQEIKTLCRRRDGRNLLI
jgi:hypothetical protein